MSVATLPGRTAFDALADTYDAGFTESPLGHVLRKAVWRRLDALYEPGDHVLELGCGTGEDAAHLGSRRVQVLATDASAAMVVKARRKCDQRGATRLVEVAQLPIEDLAGWVDGGGHQFDGAFSNFGPLNCVSGLAAAGDVLAECVRPGGRVLLCLMGRYCLWEWAWYLAHGQVGKAFRRLRRGGVEWRGTRVQYQSPGSVAYLFRSGFMVRRVWALGLLLPPTYAAGWLNRRPALLAVLNAAERALERAPMAAWLSDHYVIELERRP